MPMLTPSFQIVSFLGKERMVEFLGLKTNEERISFMYRHEAYRPLLQVKMRTKILMMMKFRRFCRIECEDEDKNKVDQPSRVSSPGAVGGVNLEGTRLSSDEPVKLV